MIVFAGRFLVVTVPIVMIFAGLGAAGWARSPERRAQPIAVFCAMLGVHNLWLIPAVWYFYHR